MIDPYVLHLLIEAGSQPDPEGPQAALLLEQVRNHDEINRLHWDTWDQVTQFLPVADLVALIKALMIAEHRFTWSGGSVSAVIWTFRALERRHPEQARLVADWILPRTTNEYLPFGFYNHQAKSYAEYQQRVLWHEQFRAESHRWVEANIAAARQLRLDRFQRGLERVEQQKIDRAAREEVLARLSEKTALERLIYISQDQQHPPEYYPAEFAQITDEELEMVDAGIRRSLLEKIRDRKKGPWKVLCQQIVQSEGGISHTNGSKDAG